jgi:hypothetical protein
MFQQNFRIFLGFSKTDRERYIDSDKQKGKADNRQKNERKFRVLNKCFYKILEFFYILARQTERGREREERQLDRKTTENLRFYLDRTMKENLGF